MVDMKQPVEKAELDMQREDHQFQLEMQKQQVTIYFSILPAKK